MDRDSPHILVVDDDKRIRELLSKFLQDNNFFVSTAKDTEEANSILEDLIPDLIILDVMLPKQTGFEFASVFRQESDIPILMLTALGETEDRITGLEKGADDYLAKPFEPRELVLRIKKILQRNKSYNPSSGKTDFVKIGQLDFDMVTGRLSKQGTLIPLTTSEAKLLAILVENHSKAMSRESLASLCGGINERSIDVQITRLRNKIEADPKKPFFLQTVRGEGYILNL
jgi:two-component system phosphate regulon response regulator OmpR